VDEVVGLLLRRIWAPIARRQVFEKGGVKLNLAIEVGEGDRAFAEQFISAYDTEKRLQAQGLAPAFSVESVVIEAGPSYFDSAVKQVGEGIASATTELAKRDTAPYVSTTK